jgi:hypothetical protein
VIRVEGEKRALGFGQFLGVGASGQGQEREQKQASGVAHCQAFFMVGTTGLAMERAERATGIAIATIWLGWKLMPPPI